MSTVLVSGAKPQVQRVAAALRAQGATVTEVVNLDDMSAACAAAGGGAFDSYVQLPSTFQMSGDTAVERVHHFYADGVLARFPALQAAIPALRPGGRVTFVLGQLPAEVASRDDRDARESLTKVLAHAARADATQGALSIELLGFDTPLEDIVAISIGADPVRRQAPDDLSELDYADWRVEVLGLANLEV